MSNKLFGTIKFFNSEAGYGFIYQNDSAEELFFHINEVINGDPTALFEGVPVEFQTRPGKKGREAWSVKLKQENITPETVDDSFIKKVKTDLLSDLLEQNAEGYNIHLINVLAEGIISISTPDQFSQAKQLLVYCEKTAPHECITLLTQLFNKATADFKFEFWLDNQLPYLDLSSILDRHKAANPALKRQIEARLAPLQINKKIKVQTLFRGILPQILKELEKAKRTIRVAVAWFTHQSLFDLLCLKIKAGIQVELIIINDYINNWSDGLPFQHFVDLGGRLYFSDPEHIMHHKFCLIDDVVLINGSYNWTYYAAERNIENCMFFHHEKELQQVFNEEFDALISTKELIKTVMLPPFDLQRYDLFSRKQYQSLDLTFRAKSIWSTNRRLANGLIHQALILYPENETAKTLVPIVVQVDEQALKLQMVNQTSSDLQDKRAAIQQNVISAEKQNQVEQRRLVEERTQQARVAQQAQEKIAAEADERRKNELKTIEAQRAKDHLQEIENKAREIADQQEKITADKKVADELTAMLSVVESMSKRSLEGQRGKLRINLSWNTTDDLDLHILDPDQNHIHYSKKEAICQNFKGVLDVDANASNLTHEPQENIYWIDGPPIGNYHISIVHFKVNQLQVVPFAVTIIPSEGEPRMVTGLITFNAEQTALPIADLYVEPSLGLTVTELIKSKVSI